MVLSTETKAQVPALPGLQKADSCMNNREIHSLAEACLVRSENTNTTPAPAKKVGARSVPEGLIGAKEESRGNFREAMVHQKEVV